jgi:hypothetical protein
MSRCVAQVIGAACLCLIALAGCAATGVNGPISALPAGCSRMIAEPAEIDPTMSAASPGDTLCFVGDRLADAELVLTRSGNPGAPITLRGGVTRVRSLTVKADNVSIRGFQVAGGQGIELEGTGLEIQKASVRDASDDGIACRSCTDAVIEENNVERALGTGILVSGERVAVRGNTITGSVAVGTGDADGVRFFGSDHRITGNTIKDIKDDGYPGEPPHTDCFQTFDNGNVPPTVRVAISDNRCENVDHQCLIATAEVAGTSGNVGRSRDLIFDRNACEVEGSQAVLVRWFPEVKIRNNQFAGPGLDRGAYVGDDSTGAEYRTNTTPPGVKPVQVDASSQAGFVYVAAQLGG